MKLTQIRHLIAVAQKGGLRRAARHLNVAQPAITRSIRELEHELDASLFERRSTGMVLTPVGEAFFKRGAAVQRELERAADEVRQLKGVLEGSVSLGLSTAAHLTLLPRVLGPFQQRFPNVLLHVAEGLYPEMENGLREGLIDFYVGPVWEQGLPSELASELFFENTRIVIGRAGGRFSDSRTLADLAQARWVATSVTASAKDELYPVFEHLGLPQPRIAATTRTALSTVAVVASSDLLAMMPAQWRVALRETGRLIELPLREPLRAPAICMVARSTLPLTPAAEHLADMFRRAALNAQNPN